MFVSLVKNAFAIDGANIAVVDHGVDEGANVVVAVAFLDAVFNFVNAKAAIEEFEDVDADAGDENVNFCFWSADNVAFFVFSDD